MRPHISRIFLSIIVIIILIFSGVYFAFTQEQSPLPSSFTESTIDSYLLSRHNLSLSLDRKQDELFQIYCDESLGAQEFEEVGTIVYPCQNQNPIHKIVLGEVSDKRNIAPILSSLGNEHLYWAKSIVSNTETGSMECKPRSDYMAYQDVKSGFECITTLSSGGTFSSSVVFLTPKKGSDKEVFLAIVGLSKSKTFKDTDLELLSILSNKQETIGGSFLSSLSFFFRSRTDEISTSTVSAADSNESSRQEGSFSGNKVTVLSGDGIDATVCSAAKVTSCYPIYCNTATAVWNYSLHKCVEPSVPNNLAAQGELCGPDAPIWDGSKCRPLSGNLVSGGACTIASGKNSCSMDITWSASSQVSDIEVRLLDTETIVLSRAASGTISYPFTFKASPYVVELYDGNRKISEGTFLAKCSEGGFDKTKNVCNNPRTINVSTQGEYYNATGTLIFSCIDASLYRVFNTDKTTLVATGTYQGETKVPIISSGNYAITCSSDSFDGIPFVRYYNAPPAPSPSPTLILSPQRVSSGGTTTISWKTAFPNDECTLQARVYCKSSGCTEPQTLVEEALNRVLSEGYTEKDDPDGVRSIKEALTTITPKTLDSGWYAMGKKTVNVSYPTDFILSCGNGTEERKRVYTGNRESSSQEY